jgi:hypothetical protein
MPNTAILALAPWVVASLLSACTAEQVYLAGQGYQRNQCNGLPDKADYDRCMSRTNTPYDSYKRQTEPTRK